MLYLIKIAYTMVFPPGIIILLLFCTALWLQQKKEYLGTLLVGLTAILLCVSAMPYFSNSLLHSIERRYAPPDQVSGDVLVVLMGGATLNTPDPLTKGTGYLTGNSAARVLTVAELYQSTKLPILLSGGQVFPDSGNESQIAKRHLIALGVPEAAITMDDTSRNTEENAQHTAAILADRGWQHPILITSAFHMPRSVKQFQTLKVDILPFPTDYMAEQDQLVRIGNFVPSASGLAQTAIALKEYLGLLAAKG